MTLCFPCRILPSFLTGSILVVCNNESLENRYVGSLRWVDTLKFKRLDSGNLDRTELFSGKGLRFSD